MDWNPRSPKSPHATSSYISLLVKRLVTELPNFVSMEIPVPCCSYRNKFHYQTEGMIRIFTTELMSTFISWEAIALCYSRELIILSSSFWCVFSLINLLVFKTVKSISFSSYWSIYTFIWRMGPRWRNNNDELATFTCHVHVHYELHNWWEETGWWAVVVIKHSLTQTTYLSKIGQRRSLEL